MVNAYFSIEFGNGKCFTLTNVTTEEIRVALIAAYPQWREEIRERHIADESNYRKPQHQIDVENVRLQIAKRGTPLNALIRLAKSYDAYYRNGYRQWGHAGRRVIDLLRVELLSLHNAYVRYQNARTNSALGNALNDIVKCLERLHKNIYAKGCDKLRFERLECLDGNQRRLGIIELAERTPIVLAEISLN